MAVIAVLVAVAIPTFTNQLEKSRQAVDVSNLRGAYAAARLAEIDQAVNNRTFKAIAESTTTGAVTALKFWYSSDSGNLTHITADDEAASSVNGTAAQFGRATKATVVADVSQLPNVCKYYYNGTNIAAFDTNTETPDVNDGKVGTLDKCILVEFEASGNEYKIKSISFVPFANTEPVSSLTVTGYERADTLGDTITIKATDDPSSKLTGVKFTATLADGTSINATVDFKSGDSTSVEPTDETWGTTAYTSVSATSLTEGTKIYYRTSVEGSTVYSYGTISTVAAGD